MKKVFLPMMLALSLMMLLSSASATNVPLFTNSPGVAPSTLGALPSGTLVVSTGLINFSFGTVVNPTKNNGTLEEDVYRDASNHLFFVFQIHVTGGNNGDIERLSTGDWDNSISIDAEQYAPGADKKALGVDRNGFGTVGINWTTLLVKGQTSSYVVLYTDATQFMAGALGLIDSGSSPSMPGYVGAPAPTPEPATLSLVGLGLVGLGTLRKKLQK